MHLLTAILCKGQNLEGNNFAACISIFAVKVPDFALENDSRSLLEVMVFGNIPIVCAMQTLFGCKKRGVLVLTHSTHSTFFTDLVQGQHNYSGICFLLSFS